MITLIFAFIASHLLAVVAVVAPIVTLLIGHWNGKRVATKADQPKIADAQAEAATAEVNARASQKSTESVVNKDDAVQSAAGKTDAQLRQGMNDEFGS